jgi:phage anti-repressor protein
MNVLITKKENELIIPETINFTELVKSSNTTLSLDFQSKLVETLKGEFTETQQQWYVANLYIYMHYHPTNDYPINLENVYRMIGFANKGNAMKTIKSNFVFDEDYKVALFHTEKRKNEGGFNKETVMLNVDTFKNLCMLAKTDKGKEIRKYYVKLENITHRILKEELEYKSELIENNEHAKKVERHNFLIEKFKYKKCVYIADVGEGLRKIGSSKNIETRIMGLKENYGNCFFLDIFECDNFRDIEESILKDSQIVQHLYKNPIHNNLRPQEVIQLTDSFTYLHCIEIVKKYLKQALFLSPDKQLESKRIDFIEWLIKEKNYTLDDIEKLSKITFNSENRIETFDQSIEPVTCIGYNSDPVVEKLIKARSIDKIHPDTLTVLETYESIGVVVKNYCDEKYEYNQLYRSIMNNKIYKNYRWNYHGQPIKPTVGITKFANPVETIVKLNKDKTKVIETFLTKKAFMTAVNISFKQATRIMENKELFNGFYYLKHSDCDNIAIDVPKYNNPCSKRIKQINVATKQEFIYNSMYDVYKAHGLSRQTIKKYINEKKEYCGFLWEYIH